MRRDHDRAGFRCGEPALDEYLARYARQNHADDLGIAVVVIDAKHEKAKAFYSHYGFKTLPDQPLTLWLLLPTLRELLDTKRMRD